RINAVLLVVLLFAGCEHSLVLYPVGGGGAGNGSANEMGNTVTINLNGKTYAGNYVHDGGTVVPTTSYTTATAYSRTGTATAYGQTHGTAYIPGSGNGRLLATSKDGDAIRCEFTYRNGNGLGVCSDNAGKQYDLKID